MKKKTYYELYLVKGEEGKEEFLAKIKGKELAMKTKLAYNKMLEGKGKIVIK